MIVDVQEVGVRCYTHATTADLLREAAAVTRPRPTGVAWQR